MFRFLFYFCLVWLCDLFSCFYITFSVSAFVPSAKHIDHGNISNLSLNLVSSTKATHADTQHNNLNVSQSLFSRRSLLDNVITLGPLHRNAPDTQKPVLASRAFSSIASGRPNSVHQSDFSASSNELKPTLQSASDTHSVENPSNRFAAARRAPMPITLPSLYGNAAQQFNSGQVLLQLQAALGGNAVPKGSTTKHAEEKEVPILHVGETRDTLYNYYVEWLQLLLEEMHGPEWLGLPPQQRRITRCSKNIRLEHQGCALLVPTCKNYSTSNNLPTGWSCEMSLWPACSCSRSYTSFLRYLIPPTHECYGNVLHSTDLVSLLGISYAAETTADDSHMVLIPVGYCGWSGFFAFFVVMVASVIIGLIGVLWKPILRAIQLFRKQRLTRSATGSVLRHGPSDSNLDPLLQSSQTTSTVLKDN